MGLTLKKPYQKLIHGPQQLGHRRVSERMSKRIHLLLWLREYHTLLEPLQFSMALSG